MSCHAYAHDTRRVQFCSFLLCFAAFLLLGGTVDLQYSTRGVREEQSGEHLGEMANAVSLVWTLLWMPS